MCMTINCFNPQPRQVVLQISVDCALDKKKVDNQTVLLNGTDHYKDIGCPLVERKVKDNGIDPANITWVMPRDAWLID